jgi:hypothetical protein
MIEKTAMNMSLPGQSKTCIKCDVEFCRNIELDIEKFNRKDSTNITQTQSNNNRFSQSTALNRNNVTSTNSRNTQLPRSVNSFDSNSNSSNRGSLSAKTQKTIIGRDNTPNRSLNTSNPIVCECNLEAALLTTRKDGPNQNRQFYKCGSNPNVCNFFLWKDATGNTTTNQNRKSPDSFTSNRTAPQRRGNSTNFGNSKTSKQVL